MIVLPQPSEKELAALNTTTQVYYATVPDPRATPDGVVGGPADRLDDNLYLDDEPPAYDAQQPTAPSGVPVGDVKDPRIFNNGLDCEDNDAARNAGTSAATSGHGTAFEPLVMHSRSKKLEDGFYSMFPPTDKQPHPLTERGIGESDWKKFLSDLQTSARLSSSGTASLSQSNEGLNFFQNLGNTLRSISASAIGKQVDSGNHRGPAALVDTWNENFFYHHGLGVVLAKGSHRLNGDKNLLPPDFLPETRANGALEIRLALPPTPSVPPVPPMPITSTSAVHSSPGIPRSPVPGTSQYHAKGDHKARHSASTCSLYSSSDSASESDTECVCERGHSNHHEHSRSDQTRCCTSHAERRAAKRVRKAERRLRRPERKERRREKRQERKANRYAHKWDHWQEKIAGRSMEMGIGRGMMPMRGYYEGRGRCHAASYSHNGYGGAVGGPLALVQGIASLINKEGDGYYRIIVTEHF